MSVVRKAAGALPDPHTGIASRFPLVSYEDALAVLRRFRPLGTESVAVTDVVGRVLARPVRAAIDVPHFARAYMDGYAVRAADTAGASDGVAVPLRVVGFLLGGIGSFVTWYALQKITSYGGEGSYAFHSATTGVWLAMIGFAVLLPFLPLLLVGLGEASAFRAEQSASLVTPQR